MKITHTNEDIVNKAFENLEKKYPKICIWTRKSAFNNFGETIWFTLHFSWHTKKRKDIKGMRKYNGRYTSHACWHVYRDFFKLLEKDCYYKSAIKSTYNSINIKLIEKSVTPDGFWDYHLWHDRKNCSCLE